MTHGQNGNGQEWRFRLFEAELRHIQKDVDDLEKKLERTQDAIGEIEEKIGRAILWLAIAASGIVFSIVRAKLGI